MARTHGLDKRKAEEQAMAKSGKHDGGSSITQESVSPTGSPGKPYKSGANVAKGSKPARQGRRRAGGDEQEREVILGRSIVERK